VLNEYGPWFTEDLESTRETAERLTAENSALHDDLASTQTRLSQQADTVTQLHGTHITGSLHREWGRGLSDSEFSWERGLIWEVFT